MVTIEIKTTPDLTEDYVRFFDTTPHADNKRSTGAIASG